MSLRARRQGGEKRSFVHISLPSTGLVKYMYEVPVVVGYRQQGRRKCCSAISLIFCGAVWKTRRWTPREQRAATVAKAGSSGLNKRDKINLRACHPRRIAMKFRWTPWSHSVTILKCLFDEKALVDDKRGHVSELQAHKKYTIALRAREGPDSKPSCVHGYLEDKLERRSLVSPGASNSCAINC